MLPEQALVFIKLDNAGGMVEGRGVIGEGIDGIKDGAIWKREEWQEI